MQALIKLINGEVLLATITYEDVDSIEVSGVFEIKENINPFAKYAKAISYWLPIPFDHSVTLNRGHILLITDISDIASLSGAYKASLERAEKLKFEHNTTDFHQHVTPEEDNMFKNMSDDEVTKEDVRNNKVVQFTKKNNKPTSTYSSSKLTEKEAKVIKDFLENDFDPEDDGKN